MTKALNEIILDTDKNPVKLRASLRKQVTHAMWDRAKAHGLKTEMEEINKGANEILLPILTSHDISKYQIEDLGTCFKKTSKGSKIDAGALLIGMMEEGLDSDTAKGIIKAASKSWSTEYVEFRRAK